MNPQILHPTRSTRPLIAYFDIKSPYAYLAKDPTRELAEDLGIEIDWRPFVLDISSYLGSAKLDKSGKVAEQNRSADQWSGIKYAYFDCRRYANLRDITLRGTVKIWDTRLVSIGMLWAKQHSDAVLHAYLDLVYEPFWKRELDVESQDNVVRLLATAGARTDGFSAYAEGAGGDAHDALQRAAFTAGVYGVPTYIVANQFYFGREHLPRIRWHLTGEQGLPPPIGNEASGPLDPVQTLEIWIDFNSAQSYAAHAGIVAMIKRLDEQSLAKVSWRSVAMDVPKPPPAGGPPQIEDRGARHRWMRSHYQDRDMHRYASQPLHAPYTRYACEAADLGLQFLGEVSPQQQPAYVEHLFGLRFDAALTTARDFPLSVVASVLAELVGDTKAGAFVTELPRLKSQLDLRREEFSALGLRSAPAFVIDAEPFSGGQHLPLIEARLQAI